MRAATLVSQVSPTIIACDEEWCCATWQDVFLLVWWGAATAVRARVAAASMRAFAAARPRGCALLAVVTSTATPPDSTVRPIFSQAMRDASRNIRGVVYYAPIAGFKGAAVRSVITGMALLAGEKFPTMVQSDLGRSARCVAERLDPGGDSVVLASQLEGVVTQILDSRGREHQIEAAPYAP